MMTSEQFTYTYQGILITTLVIPQHHISQLTLCVKTIEFKDFSLKSQTTLIIVINMKRSRFLTCEFFDIF